MDICFVFHPRTAQTKLDHTRCEGPHRAMTRKFVLYFLCLLPVLGFARPWGEAAKKFRPSGAPSGLHVSDIPRYSFIDGVFISRACIDLSLATWKGASHIGSAPSYLPVFRLAEIPESPVTGRSPLAGADRPPAIFQDGNGQDFLRLPSQEASRQEKMTTQDCRQKASIRAMLEAKATLRAFVEARKSSDVPPNKRNAPGRRSDDPRAGPAGITAGVWVA